MSKKFAMAVYLLECIVNEYTYGIQIIDSLKLLLIVTMDVIGEI